MKLHVSIFTLTIEKFYFRSTLTPYYDALNLAGFFSSLGNVKLYFFFNCSLRFKKTSFVATTALVLSPVTKVVSHLSRWKFRE